MPSIHFPDEVGSGGAVMDAGGFFGMPTQQGAGGSGGGSGGAGWSPHQSSSSLGTPFNRSRSASLSTPTGQTPSASSGITKKKVVTACQRCRTRKIRCDGVLPSCKSCVKANVECIEVDRSGDNNVPRR